MHKPRPPSHTHAIPETPKIFLIEDNQGDVELVREALCQAQASFEMQSASRLADALNHPGLATCHVILTDLSLPDSRGLDTMRAIHSRFPQTPLVVLTSLADDAVAFQAIELGAQDYLIKSQINGGVLQRSVRCAIQRQLLLSENLKLMRQVRDSKRLLNRKNRRLARLYETAHQFVDNVSHEFRTPLTVIKEYAALIRDGVAGEADDRRRMLNVIVDRADDLNTMVDDLLDVSKLEAGLLGAWRKNCRVSDIVRNVLPGLEGKAKLRGVSLKTAVPEHLPVVYCDGEKAGRVLINLVVNAIKFCREPGLVRLWAQHDPQAKEVVIGVTDNGAGIDERDREAIFERFKQLTADDVRRGAKGFGLGLNIAKELVQLNLGEMRLESEVGRGSTFSFTLPLADCVAVTERYLNRMATIHDGSATVSVLRASLEKGVADALCDEVDAFLHSCLLRRHDVLFRVGDRAWLFLLLAPEIELEQYLGRAQQARSDANRNRPREALPAIEFEIEGSWQIAESRHEIMDCVWRGCSCQEIVDCVRRGCSESEVLCVCPFPNPGYRRRP